MLGAFTKQQKSIIHLPNGDHAALHATEGVTCRFKGCRWHTHAPPKIEGPVMAAARENKFLAGEIAVKGSRHFAC